MEFFEVVVELDKRVIARMELQAHDYDDAQMRAVNQIKIKAKKLYGRTEATDAKRKTNRKHNPRD